MHYQKEKDTFHEAESADCALLSREPGALHLALRRSSQDRSTRFLSYGAARLGLQGP